MNRRGFFGLLAGAAALALDPEKALWVPGKKLISIPSGGLMTSEKITYEMLAILSRNVEFVGWTKPARKMKLGDTFGVRKPRAFAAFDPDPALTEVEYFTVGAVVG